MKKLTSLLLALMMVLSVLSTFVVFTSAAGNDLLKTYDAAAEGEVLYKAKFGETTGAYKSGLFAIATKGYDTDTTKFDVKVTEGGYGVEITYTPEKAQRMYYGGQVEGLTYGNGEKYTIEYYVHDAETTKTTNYGVYFNWPKAFETDNLVAREECKYLLGYYGTPSIRQTLCVGGDKYTGKYISLDKTYITDYTFAKPASGYHKVAIEVEDNAFRVYIDGTFFDEGNMYDAQMEMTPNLGISFYLYNTQTYNGDTFKAKDVTIYKGHTERAGATYPDYYKTSTTSTNVLLKEYDKAVDGDLLYTVKMDAEDGVWTGRIHEDQNKVTQYVTTENSVEFFNTGADSRFWWGDTIDGLKVNAETKYTMTLKVQSKTEKNGGFGFVAPLGGETRLCFNFYGRFTTPEGSTAQPQTVIEKSTGKIAGQQFNTTDYVPIYPVVDDEGYLDVAVVVDGFVFTVLYKSNIYGIDETETPFWAIYEIYDMEEDLEFYGEANMCFMTYTHNTTTNWEAKDVNIYKGVTVNTTGTPDGEVSSSEEETTTPAGPESSKPADSKTDKPADSTNTPGQTTAAPKAEEKGCGGMIAGGLAVLAIVALGAVAVSKKRD